MDKTSRGEVSHTRLFVYGAGFCAGPFDGLCRTEVDAVSFVALSDNAPELIGEAVRSKALNPLLPGQPIADIFSAQLNALSVAVHKYAIPGLQQGRVR